MRCSDFAELTEYLKSLNDEEKKEIWIWSDEGIVRVIQGKEDVIFQSKEIHFAYAFFILLGINIDENIEDRAR